MRKGYHSYGADAREALLKCSECGYVYVAPYNAPCPKNHHAVDCDCDECTMRKKGEEDERE